MPIYTLKKVMNLKGDVMLCNKMTDRIYEGGPWYAELLAYQEALRPEAIALSLRKTFSIQMSDLFPHPSPELFTNDSCTHYVTKEGQHYWFNRSRDAIGWYRD